MRGEGSGRENEGGRTFRELPAPLPRLIPPRVKYGVYMLKPSSGRSEKADVQSDFRL
jgi:hypothetical protein